MRKIYSKMYARMFNAVTDALQELENQNYGVARQLLMQAQFDCEEIYMQEGENVSENIVVLETSQSQFENR